MSASIQRIVPILPAKDVLYTMLWYEEKLGFERRAVYPPDTAQYGIVTNPDGAEIHFSQQHVDPKKNGFAIYLRVSGIEELYKRCRTQGIVHPEGTLETKPWGQREFAVVDPNGTLLRFGESR